MNQAGAPDSSSNSELHLHVGGMHCANCPALIEARFGSLPEVVAAKVLYPQGRAVVTVKAPLSVEALQNVIANDGYSVTTEAPTSHAPSLRDGMEVAGVFLVLVAVALVLQQLHLLPQGFGISEQMSYGLVFLIGLVASVSSCLAVTGGLMVALAAQYNQANEGLSDRQRLVPLIYFNAGRLMSYTLLGGVVGGIGSALTLSAPVTGVLTLLAAAVMILLGLHMLRIIPSLSNILPALPLVLTKRLQKVASGRTKRAAFALGSLTFFLPCGFTQALQLYVLGKASFTVGALTMLAFALGTLPALLSLSAISSFAHGGFQKHFMRFAGAAVVLLGLTNLQAGFVLTNQGSTAWVTPADVTGSDGIAGAEASEPQRISMKVVGFDYQPHQFTVKVGRSVHWWIDGSEAEGCGRLLIAPQLGIRKILSDTSTTLISFTPTHTGEFQFNCGMGMMTPDSKIIVVEGGKG